MSQITRANLRAGIYEYKDLCLLNKSIATVIFNVVQKQTILYTVLISTIKIT